MRERYISNLYTNILNLLIIDYCCTRIKKVVNIPNHGKISKTSKAFVPLLCHNRERIPIMHLGFFKMAGICDTGEEHVREQTCCFFSSSFPSVPSFLFPSSPLVLLPSLLPRRSAVDVRPSQPRLIHLVYTLMSSPIPPNSVQCCCSFPSIFNTSAFFVCRRCISPLFFFLLRCRRLFAASWKISQLVSDFLRNMIYVLQREAITRSARIPPPLSPLPSKKCTHSPSLSAYVCCVRQFDFLHLAS